MSIFKRREAFESAAELVGQIVEAHPLEPYKVGPPFGTATTVTAAGQRLDLTTELADWLLKEDA